MFGVSKSTDRVALALAVTACVIGLAGVALTTHALFEPTTHAALVRALDSRELPEDIPAALQQDAIATKPIVGLLDSLRRSDLRPRRVEWLHFRCVEAAAVLTAEPHGDPREFRASLVAAFPPTWQRTVGKDADYLRSPDGRVEIAIPEPAGRDSVDELAAALVPARRSVIALAYHLRPC